MKAKDYIQFISEIKQNILTSRYLAAKLANREQLLLYLRIGKMIHEKIEKANWGAKILDKISVDLQQELPGIRGFSAVNLKRMRVFFREWQPYLQISSALPNQIQNTENNTIKFSSTVLNQIQQDEDIKIGSAVPNLFPEQFFSLGFTHHYSIASKTNTIEERFFYIAESSQNFWTTRVLDKHINENLFHQKGKQLNNFTHTLPEKISNKAVRMFKDEYLWEFIDTEDEDNEREVEREIVKNIKKFIMSIGGDFAFMGNQYRILVDNEELFIDLLFFHRKLQCLVAFELKTTKFKAEYIGKMNLYLSVLDEYVKQPHENQSIGIILCKSKNDKFVKFAIRDFNKPMGVSTYKTNQEIPDKYRNVLPNIDDLKKIM